jgi:hypothetical protein
MIRLLTTAVLLLGMAAASPVSAQPFDDPVALVEKIYEPYLAGEIPEGQHEFFSATLETLFETAAAATPEGEIGPLDFDPVINGQDFDISRLRVQEVQNDGSAAIVEASFVNLGERQRILFMLTHGDEGWKVNDLQSVGPNFRWRLTELLSGDPLVN